MNEKKNIKILKRNEIVKNGMITDKNNVISKMKKNEINNVNMVSNNNETEYKLIKKLINKSIILNNENYNQLFKNNLILPGKLYYNSDTDLFILKINDMILKGNIRDIVPKTYNKKTYWCKYANCLIKECQFYHNKPKEKRNFKSNIFNKLIHNKAGLKKSIKNFKRKEMKEKNNYLNTHGDFIIHNILIMMLLDN